jgi:hypothetical protein
MEVDKPKREFKEFRPINAALMKKYVNKGARIFIKVEETLSGGTQVR